MVLTGCSQRAECPKIVYPKLVAIDKVPKIDFSVHNGQIDANDTRDVYNGIKALRVSEYYYWKQIVDYREKFNKDER
jgi:hypothetical protein